MPTAYTSLLGLALPVTGELQGTWGQTVNDAITSLLDTAVAGTTTLSTDADVTLTTTTGASNQARQAIILWTANGTTTRNITAPAQSKAYVVINASAGTQSIVIRGVGPTTGVTVAKGEKVLVAWNGSDFVRVAAYGGTGEFTTVDTTNLEVTNVKAKDGTSAATIADSTGVVTFTANPILNGGTANGVLYLNGSKVATSGSALTFDGTNLGIGTASPAKAIEIARGAGDSAFISLRGNGNAATAEFFVGQFSTNEAYVWNEANAAVLFGANNVEVMRAAASGYVGINNTNPATRLHISGDNVASRGQLSLATASASNFAQLTLYDRTTLGAQIYQGYGGTAGVGTLAITTATASDFVFGTNSAERMRIDASGNVGIGTASPANRFHVSSSGGEVGRFESSSQPFISLYEGATRQAYLWAQTSIVELNVEVNKPLRFMTNGAERMRITAAGLVGIGNNSPQTALQVNGTGFFGPTANAGVSYNVSSSNHSATQAANTGAGIGLYPPYTGYPSGLSGALLFAANEAASGFATYFAITTINPGGGLSERMRITSNGNVGIGTSTVAAANALEIARGSTDAALISTRANGNSAATEFAIGQGSDGTSAFIYNRANGIMAFATNNTERMRIDSAGNLGLGVTPSAWAPTSTTRGFDVYAQFGLFNATAAAGGNGTMGLLFNAYYDGAYKNRVGSAYSGAYEYSAGTGIHTWKVAGIGGVAGSTVTFSSTMTLGSAGNLALGVTDSGWGSLARAVQLPGGSLYTYNGDRVFVGLNVYLNGSNADTYVNTAPASAYRQFQGAHTWYTAPSGTAGTAVTFTEQMRIEAAGNVGIGPFSPTTYANYKTLSLGGGSTGFVIDAFTSGGINAGGTQVISRADYTSISAYGPLAGTAAYLAFATGTYTSSLERMRISGTGNVGIGTNNPTSRLYVSGGVTTSTYGSNTLYSSAGSEYQAPAANGIHLETDGWANATVISSRTGTVAATRSTYGLVLTSTYGSSSYASAAVNINCTTGNGAISFYTGTGSAAPTEQFKVHDNGNVLVLAAGGLGYGTGSGGAVTQGTSRTQGVTLDKTNGAITLFSAAGTTTWQSFTVTNNKVAATDTVIVNQKSGTDLYEIHVTAVAAGSFRISFKTTGGTTTEQPVFNFAVIKAVTA